MKTIFCSCDPFDRKARDIAEGIRLNSHYFGWAFIPYSPQSVPSISESIFEHIKQASLVLAIFGERSPNVLLELGYALGLGKQVIIVADLTSGLPFDLAAIQAVDYRMPVEDIWTKVLKFLEKSPAEGRASDVPPDLRSMLQLKVAFPERFDQLTYEAFENALKRAFAEKGYEVEIADLESDYGYDFTIKRARETALVQIKKNSLNGKVSIAAVQQLLGAIHASEVPKALLITTSEFTDAARGYASRHSSELVLWTAQDLVKFLNDQIRP